MKHWLLVSTIIIGAVVLLFRSRAVNPTLPATPEAPATSRADVPATSPVLPPATSPATSPHG